MSGVRGVGGVPVEEITLRQSAPVLLKVTLQTRITMPIGMVVSVDMLGHSA